MSCPSTTSEDVIHALTQDDTFTKTRCKLESTKTTSQAKVKGQPSKANKPDPYCPFCKKEGHNLEQCYTARKILEENCGKPPGRSQNTSKRSGDSAKAGIVETTTITNGLEDHSDSEKSSTVIFSKAVSLSSAAATKGRDANVDSGCSQSMTPHKDQLCKLVTDCTKVCLANDATITATHRGAPDHLFVPGRSDQSLLVPDLSEPLLSVAGLADDGLVAVFDYQQVSSFNKSNFSTSSPVVGRGEHQGNLNYLPEEASHHSISFASTQVDKSLFNWHCVFNHVGLKSLKSTLQSLGIRPNVLNEIEVQQCSICVGGKMSCRSFTSRHAHRAIKRGEVVHSDVCSFETALREGYSMWVTFIDDFSKDISVYPLKSKIQMFQSFWYFQAAFEKQHQCSILTFVSDNGGEYMGTDFQLYLKNGGIQHKRGPPHSPQLNGIAERANHTLCDHI